MKQQSLLLMLFALCVMPYRIIAHTPNETNEVARLILFAGLCNEIDDYTENETHPTLFTSWDGFIGGDDVAGGWTARGKEAALLSYMSMLSTNDCRTLDDEAKGLLRVGLTLMQEYNYTNALPLVRKLIVNPYAYPIHRLSAVEMYYSWANLDQDLLAKTEYLMADTNKTWGVNRICYEAGCGAVAVTRKNHETNSVARATRNLAVDLLYRLRFREVFCALPFDGLFVEEIPGYEFSSNRLDTVIGWLNSTNINSTLSSRLIPITNRLIRSSAELVTLPNLH